MLIRLLLPWGRKEKGDVFDTTSSIAAVLVRRKFAEYVTQLNESELVSLTELSHAIPNAHNGAN